MGFKKVYKALQDIFPEVDSRALRAVAIEHSKDADTAVEVVLTEVIPFLMEKSRPLSSSSERSMVKPPEVAVDARAIARTDDALLINATGSNEEHNSSSIYDANAGHHQSVLHADAGHHQLVTEANSDHIEVNGSDEEENSSSIYGANTGHHQSVVDAYAGQHRLLTEADGDHVEVNGECASGDLSEKSRETNTVGVPDQTSDLATSTLKDPNASASHMNNALHVSVGASDESFGLDYVMEAHKDSNEEKSNISLGQAASSNVQDIMFTPECGGELIVVPDMLNFDSQYSEPSYSINTASKKYTIGEMDDIADDSTLNAMVTRSGQICSVDLLEGIIADARSNKKTLFSAMESVISLMREVELQEKAAEQAKEAAAKGGLDILSRVEDLKKMLQHAKEANDMHTGEVYGERAILATEVRELQSRLLNLSEERDKSLAVLDEMHQTLVSRLEEAEKERNVAEKEKLEKEESAGKALSEQEFIMEKVVQEANMLKQEAEENAKLREFLMDRGRVVDMLQGEISVICQDVKLLKEKFDERIPFSKSLSSSQTSCILASSSSSFKSMTPDHVDQVPDQSDLSENLKKSEDLIPSPNEQQFSGGSTAGDDRKALVDEGWEIFENGDYM